jgi:hypothetical protein
MTDWNAADWEDRKLELLRLIQDIRLGKLPEMTPSRRALVEAAMASNEARKNEDIDAWAKRLAADVAECGD